MDPYILLGSSLDLNCSLTSRYTGSLNASFLYFELNSALLPTTFFHVISADTLNLHVPNVTRKYAGKYYCMLNETAAKQDAVPRAMAVTEVAIGGMY